MLRKGQDLRQCANQHDIASAALFAWMNLDPLDQRADDRHRLGPCGFVREHVPQFRDLAFVEVGQIGMKFDRIVEVGRAELRFDLLLAGFKGLQSLAYRSGIALAIGDKVETTLDPLLDLGMILDQLSPGAVPLLAQACDFLPESLGEFLEQGLVAEQQVPEAVENAAFQLLRPDAAIGVADALLAPRRAIVAVAAGDRHAAAATPALDETAEQTLAGLALVAAARGIARLDRLHLLPDRILDDPQRRNFGGNPFMLRIGPRYPLARLRVLHEALPVIDDPAEIKLVVEDAVAALSAAVDRGGVPGSAARAGDAFGVEPGRDPTRCKPACIFVEDATHDCRLLRIDLALAGRDRPVFQQAPDHPVAVAVAARDLAGFDPAALPAPGLLGQVLQEQRVHRALEADMQFVDLALGQGDEADIGMAKPLVDRRDILLVAAHAIQRLGKHGVEAATPRRLQQREHAGAVVQAAAADRVVGEDLHHGHALAFGLLAAQPHLVVDRTL